MQSLRRILSFDSVTALRGCATVEAPKGKAMSARENDDKPGKKKTSQGVGREKAIYAKRFTEKEDKRRRRTWKALCRHFFQKYIAPEDTVLDIGAGDGLFIRNIIAKRRIVADLNPQVESLRAEDIEVLNVPAAEIAEHLDGQVDVVFMSNFLEHLPSKILVLDVLQECFSVLKAGGKILILQPNIRYVGAAYWDYIDHHIALTEHSLAEALQTTGFQIKQIVPRFFPYTAKSRLGILAPFTALYLKLPILWRFFGKQTFVLAEKPTG